MSVKSVTVGARYMDKLAGGIWCEVDDRLKLKGALQIIYMYIASFRTTMYRNRWTVYREPMPKRQSEDEFVSVYTPLPLVDGRTGSRKRARRGDLTTIHYRDGCPETVQSLYYSLWIAPSFRLPVHVYVRTYIVYTIGKNAHTRFSVETSVIRARDQQQLF